MFFFELRKRTKKRGEFGFSPHPLKPPLAKCGMEEELRQNMPQLPNKQN